MNIITHLQFGDNVTGLYNKDYLVVESRTHFGRDTDSFHPETAAKCKSFEVSVIAPSKKDLLLQEWFYNDLAMSGRLVYQLSDAGSDHGVVLERILTFTDAKCFKFSEKFEINNERLRIFDLTISAAECEIDNVKF